MSTDPFNAVSDVASELGEQRKRSGQAPRRHLAVVARDAADAGQVDAVARFALELERQRAAATTSTEVASTPLIAGELEVRAGDGGAPRGRRARIGVAAVVAAIVELGPIALALRGGDDRAGSGVSASALGVAPMALWSGSGRAADDERRPEPAARRRGRSQSRGAAQRRRARALRRASKSRFR